MEAPRKGNKKKATLCMQTKIKSTPSAKHHYTLRLFRLLADEKKVKYRRKGRADRRL